VHFFAEDKKKKKAKEKEKGKRKKIERNQSKPGRI